MSRGVLRVYLGAAPGVGKTFAMLSEGRRRRDRGSDVVVALVETHGRPHTAELLDGLEVTDRCRVEHRGTTHFELDVEAVLRRRPEVVLVDELAHTVIGDPAGPTKRWQQVDRLLAAGIDVISTVNVQHLESLNDVVAEITGIRQQETIPDEVVRAADQIELVDMSPEALRRRLAHGNVYHADKVDAALSHFFRVGNLGALRELALLWVADRVDAGLAQYRAQHGIDQPWPARERVIVALAGGPEGETLLRRGARIAQRGVGGELIAVHVGRSDGLLPGQAGNLEAQRALTERLGGSFHRIVGDNIAEAITDFARGANATLIVIGASSKRPWQSLFVGSVSNAVVTGAGEAIDVHVVTHDRARRGSLPRRKDLLGLRRRVAGWIAAIIVPAALVAAESLAITSIGLTTEAVLTIAVTVGVALLGGLWPAIVAAVWGSLLLNWFRTPPLHTITIASPGNALALLITVVVGAAVASVVDIAARRSNQARRAGRDAEILSILAGSVVRGEDTVAAILEQLRTTFKMTSVSLVERDDPRSAWRSVQQTASPAADPTGSPAGVDRPAQDDIEIRVTPTLGLVLRGPDLDGGSRRVLEAFAAQATVVLERERLRQRAEEAGRLEAGDAMRRTLLAAVSHDLRTPLASIKASVTSLQQRDVDFSPEDHDQLLQMVQQSTVQLERLVDNLLDMSRLQSGTARPRSQQISVDEVVWPALASVPATRVRVEVDETLPLIITDPGLLERALGNIVENAVRHTPDDTVITITARLDPTTGDRPMIEIRVVDHGPGVSDDAKERMFDSFQQVGDRRRAGGLGLGLAVARGFSEAVGGRLTAEDTPGGGLTMVISVPTATGAAASPAPSETLEGLR
ncbi:ATP-binding protein [Microlunatus soli]|uniref:histidine kinase n=1 Tax=Microlunatus soli TaxID=630515 RepID=A0A1H1Z9C4_9ACTN|nr:ATP-binding protein [Microlunatus soli]SDT30288.1 two-component system, OmpR family, sensor histidine kinase KdpD [Microlunatus soli]